MKTHKRLGDYIQEIDVRNRDLSVTKLLGLSMTKQFRPSTSNIIGVDLSKYKIVGKNVFAFDTMSVIRVHKVPIAINNTDSPIIVSPAYVTFECKNSNELDPQYLMMWFMRNEFDRYADFKSDAAVRGGYDWDELCDTSIYIPPIERQREIVAEYETLSKRIRLNEQMISKLEETAQTLYRKMFVDGIDKENLPEGWRIGVIQDLCEVKDGTHDSPKPVDCGFPLVTSAHLNTWNLSLNQTYTISKQDYIKINERSLVENRDILFSMIGTIGTISLILYNNINFAVKNMAIFKTSKNLKYVEYLLCFLKSAEMNIYIEGAMSGSTQSYVTLNTLRIVPILIPDLSVIEQFHCCASKIISQIWNITRENEKLTELQSLLLARMGR